MRRAQSLRHHIGTHSRSTTLGSADDLGMLREYPNDDTTSESVEDALRRQLLEKDREMDKLLARNVALEDELSQRPPLDELKRLQAEKKEVDWLFASSNRLNEKCMAKEQRDARWIGVLERKLAEIVGEDWQSTLNISSSSALAGGDVSSFLPQAESTILGRTSTPDSFIQSHSPSRNYSPMLTSSATITPTYRTSSPSPSFTRTARHGHTPMNSTTSLQSTASLATTTTLAHIAEVRALVLGMDEKFAAREAALTEEVARATQASDRLAAVRREMAGAATVSVS